MVTPASPDMFADWWDALMTHESEAGEIPLPAVDSIILDEGRLPAIWLIVPEGTPGTPTALVDVEGMGLGDRLTLETFLRNLERLLIDRTEGKITGRLYAVWHLGGLDYEFHFTGGEVPLNYLPPGLWQAAWTMLRAIACIGEHSINVEASVPRAVGAD
jgi:hypothetical protein